MLSMIMFAAAFTVPAPSPEALPSAICQKARAEMAGTPSAARAKKLNELPNANLVLGVLRHEGGCQKPVIVRYDIGSAPKAR
jgi:hypothetical protein